jgi:hypothetical protein
LGLSSSFVPGFIAGILYICTCTAISARYVNDHCNSWTSRFISYVYSTFLDSAVAPEAGENPIENQESELSLAADNEEQKKAAKMRARSGLAFSLVIYFRIFLRIYIYLCLIFVGKRGKLGEETVAVLRVLIDPEHHLEVPIVEMLLLNVNLRYIFIYDAQLFFLCLK